MITDLIILFGYLSAFERPPTDGTLAYHGLDVYWPYVDGFVAVADCSLIGQPAKLSTTAGVLDVIVFDCAGHLETVEWMNDDQIVAEVDWYLWQRYPEIVGGPAKLLVMNHKARDKWRIQK